MKNTILLFAFFLLTACHSSSPVISSSSVSTQSLGCQNMLAPTGKEISPDQVIDGKSAPYQLVSSLFYHQVQFTDGNSANFILQTQIQIGLPADVMPAQNFLCSDMSQIGSGYMSDHATMPSIIDRGTGKITSDMLFSGTIHKCSAKNCGADTFSALPAASKYPDLQSYVSSTGANRKLQFFADDQGQLQVLETTYFSDSGQQTINTMLLATYR